MDDRLNILSKKRFAPTDMGDLSGKTFDEVFRFNKVFTDFSYNKMESGTGVFKLWLEFIKLQKNVRRSSVHDIKTHQ